ncbi:MAG: hypothetical protein EXR72_25070 [Myxococcales bacterium]|nr:hypothetical protein [Myxococcales bacterium]
MFKTIVVYREAPPAPGRGARFAAYGVGVVAVGALATGIALGVLAQRKSDFVAAGANPEQPQAFEGAYTDAESAGRTFQVVSWVGFGVAAVGAAGAIGLFLLGSRIDREAPRVSFAPALAPSGGGLAVAGSF